MKFFVLMTFMYAVKINCDNCINSIEKNTPEYYLISACHRSKLNVIDSYNNKSLEECKNLAIKRRAMAFNFSPIERFEIIIANDRSGLKSCMILYCPEIENSTSLVQDFKYDYYSIFTNPIPPINATCIEGVGIFVYHTLKLNYADSRKTCRSFGSELADVGTETRTSELSKHASLLSGSGGKFKMFYAGMDDLKIEGEFLRSNGDSLRCSTYRAWAPGHPRDRRTTQDCVVLDGYEMWHVVDCGEKFPFICEIFPGGYYDYYDDYEILDCTELVSSYD